MEKSMRYVGIDVAKQTLEVDLADGKSTEVRNEAAAIQSLLKRLKRRGNLVVCCEATGGYEKRLVDACRAAGIPVAVVMPRRVRHFASSKGILAKTDKIDAKVLTMFGQQNQPVASEALPEEVQGLQEMLIRRDELVGMRKQEQCRLDTCRCGVSVKSIKKHITFIEKQITQIEAAIQDLLNNHPSLQAKVQRLTDVKCLGQQSALSLLGFVPELGTISDKEASALVGVAPYNDDSGKKQGVRKTQGGRPRVRKVLYMAAVSASKYNPILKAYYRRLRDRGKPAKVALVALMRKLVVLANRLLADPEFTLA